MHFETMEELCKKCPSLPVVRKCCFCVPIRKGVTIFGYVNLVFSLLSFPVLIFILVEHATGGTTIEEATGRMDPLTHVAVTIVFVALDVVMTIVLLIGAHKKNRALLRVYLYLGVVFQIATLCIDLVYFDYREYLENIVYLIFLGLNIYLFFLVYNTVRVIEESSEVQYVPYQDQQLNL